MASATIKAPKPPDGGDREKDCMAAVEQPFADLLNRTTDAGWNRHEAAVALLRTALAAVNRLYPPAK